MVTGQSFGPSHQWQALRERAARHALSAVTERVRDEALAAGVPVVVGGRAFAGQQRQALGLVEARGISRAAVATRPPPRSTTPFLPSQSAASAGLPPEKVMPRISDSSRPSLVIY